MKMLISITACFSCTNLKWSYFLPMEARHVKGSDKDAKNLGGSTDKRAMESIGLAS